MDEHRIQKEVWEQVTRAKLYKEYSDREEYSFLTKTFESGLVCSFSDQVDSLRLSVDRGNGGFKVELAERYRGSDSNEVHVLSSLVQSVLDGFMKNYFSVMGQLPPNSKDDKSTEV